MTFLSVRDRTGFPDAAPTYYIWERPDRAMAFPRTNTGRHLLGPHPPAGKSVIRQAVRGLDGNELLAIGGDEYLYGWCHWV